MQIQTDRNQKEIKAHGTYEFPVRVSHEWLSSFERNSFMWHWHPELEWTFVMEGEIEYQIHDQVHRLKPGDGILCNSSMPHTGRPVDGNDCHYISITFHPRLLEGYKDSFLKEKYVDPIVGNPSLPCLRLSPDTAWQAEILDKLRRIKYLYLDTEQKDDHDFQIYLLLLEIWMTVCRHTPSFPENQISSLYVTRLKQILSYIHNHYAEKITLEDIAHQVNICPSECCRFFKKNMHESLFDYLLNYRIEQSLSLLGKELPITEVASRCGFSSPSYFSKEFRKRMGSTPKEYRRQTESRSHFA